MKLHERLWHQLGDIYTDGQYTSTALFFDIGGGKDHTRKYMISMSERTILEKILDYWRDRI